MRALVCPLGSPGYAFPAVAIGRALVARGHEVTFVAPSWLERLVRGAGLPWVAGDALDASRWHDPGVVAHQVGTLSRQVAGHDLLLTSVLALGPLMVAETARVPISVIGLLTPLLPEGGSRRAELDVAYAAARSRVGLPPSSVERMLGDLHLRRGVQGPDAIGACAWEPATPAVVRDWLRTRENVGERIVYVQQARTFGAPGFWDALCAALPSDVRVAASTGRMDGGVAVPKGALLGAVVPHGAVLARAVACVCSGTTAVVVAAMAAGVPLVVVPAGGEQLDVAALVEQLRVGVVVPAHQATPTRLAEALGRAVALDPAPRFALARAFAAIDGPQRAAERLERLQSGAEATP